jgi:TonB family protein
MGIRESGKSWEGRTVEGKFSLRQWLGGSDHSAVFLTEQGGQKAAIKLVAADDADRQLSHWTNTAKLSHPNLLRLFETGRCEFDGQALLYVVMEYAEENLSQIIPERALDPGEVADLLPPILDALSYLQGKGLVHGRVRPSNILAIDNQLKLSADSLSPWGETNQPRNPQDVYDAPEYASGDISPAVDVWSLGATLVAVLTQHPPVYRAAEQKDPVVPQAIPEPFRSIARECLHFQVKQRCTVADIKAWRPPQAATPVAAPATVTAVVTPKSVATPIREDAPSVAAPPKRSRARVIIAAAVVLVAVFIVIALGRRASQDNSSAQQAEPPANTQAEKTAPETSAPPTTPVTTQPQISNPRTTPSGNGAVVHQVMPEVPPSARNTIRGKIKVVVRVDVDSSGKVTSAKLAHSGSSRYFANLALKAAQQWEFSASPAGAPPSRWNLTFQFAKAGTKASAAPERARR